LRLTLHEYWEQQSAGLKKRHVAVSPKHHDDVAVLFDPDDPYGGMIDGRAWFDDDAYLDIYELVSIDRAGVAHREKYSYQLIVDGEECGREDFDPKLHDPALRYHVNRVVGGMVTHEPSDRVTLVRFIDQCYGITQESRYGSA
jgi:hypothetical protein